MERFVGSCTGIHKHQSSRKILENISKISKKNASNHVWIIQKIISQQNKEIVWMNARQTFKKTINPWSNHLAKRKKDFGNDTSPCKQVKSLIVIITVVVNKNTRWKSLIHSVCIH